MKKGFTLIELLVVVVIIGLLATILMINLIHAQAKSRDAQRKKDLTLVAGALDNYYVDHKAYPDNGSPTDTNFYPFATAAGLVALHAGGYIGDLPADPSPAGTSVYEYRMTGTAYKLRATAPETLTNIAGGAQCGTDPQLQRLTGDFCNPVDVRTFQISSSETARLSW